MASACRTSFTTARARPGSLTFSSTTIGTSRYFASTAASVGILMPQPRNGNSAGSEPRRLCAAASRPNSQWPRRRRTARLKKYPASARASSSAVRFAIGPVRFVVRSSVRSWWTTTTPSAERRTSSSRPWAPGPGRCRRPRTYSPARARSRLDARTPAAGACRRKDGTTAR